jgi:berberine-like enzyme
VEYAAAKPSALSGILVQTVCGAASRVKTDAMAFRHRAFPYAPVIVSQWLDAADTGRNVSWASDCWQALHPFAAGGRVPVAYGANYQRLAELKKKYDPDNLFHLNPNIKPAE